MRNVRTSPDLLVHRCINCDSTYSDEKVRRSNPFPLTVENYMPDHPRARLSPSEVLTVADLFARAMELPPNERLEFVGKHAGNSEAVRVHIVELLRANSKLDAFLESPPPLPASLVISDPFPGVSLSVGQTIGDFELVEVIGRGGFAIVYLAHQISLDRKVALKVSQNVGDEAKILAQLEHDNIVRVFSQSIDHGNDLRIICMQYIAGKNLAEVFELLSSERRGRLSGADIAHVVENSGRTQGTISHLAVGGTAPLAQMDFTQAAMWIGGCLSEALDYAHRNGVLHLDVKPSNVLLSSMGRPYLTDFNVSFNHRVNAPDRPKIIGGTAEYMPPEQLKAMKQPTSAGMMGRVDHRADIYSLGMVMKEFFALNYANDVSSTPISSNYTLSLKSPLGKQLIPERGLRWASLDATASYVLFKCCRTAPNHRFQSAGDLAQAFRGALELREAIKGLPAPDWFTRAGIRYPTLYLFLLHFVPLLLGTLGCILFRKRLLVDTLSLLPLTTLCLWETIILGGVIAFMLTYFAGLIRSLVKYFEEALEIPHFQDLAKNVRHDLIRLPTLWLAMMTLLWLPGNVMILFRLHWSSVTLQADTWGRVLLASALVGLATTLTSALLGVHFGLRALYPRFWLGVGNIRLQATHELTRLSRRISPFFFLVFVFLVLELWYFKTGRVAGSMRVSSLLIGVCVIFAALSTLRTLVRCRAAFSNR